MQGSASHRPVVPVVVLPHRPVVDLPPVPHWFGPEARRAWKLWTAALGETGNLDGAHMLALQGACAAYQRAVAFEKVLKLDPAAKGAAGGAERAWKQVKDFCAEFGLTPSSRGRLTTVTSVAQQAAVDLEAVIA